MRIRYDPAANAAYITVLDREVRAGEAARQSDLIPTPTGLGDIILDFDASGKLIGIEVLSADAVLSAEVLATATE